MKNIDVIIFYEHVNREYESVNELKKNSFFKRSYIHYYSCSL